MTNDLNNLFPTEPSEEFRWLKAEIEAAKQSVLETREHDELKILFARIQAAWAKLREMPEQQFIDEMDKASSEAWRGVMGREVEQHGRMTAILQAEPGDEEPNLSDTVSTGRAFKDTVTVVADMKRLRASEVAAYLRKLADRIDNDGMVVYVGQSPIFPDMDLWAIEKTDGSVYYNQWKRE